MGAPKPNSVCGNCSNFTHMLPTLQIRPIAIADHYEVVANLMRLLHENELAMNPQTAYWPNIEANYMRHVIAMQEDCEGRCLLAYVDEVPVGFMFGYLEYEDDSRIEAHKGPELYISDGYVLPEYRRQGIYGRMNQLMEHHYSNMNVSRILRFTHAHNANMQSFLEQEGYKVTRLLYEKWIV